MSSSKQLGPAASDAEAPRQSPEGTAALTQPLSQRPASRDSNGGLCPTPERKKESEGHQSTISRCSDNVAESNPNKVEKPLENFVCDSSSTSDNSSIRPGDGEETSVSHMKRLPLSQGPSDSDRSSGQDVDLLLEFQFISWTEVYNQYLERSIEALYAVADVLQQYGLTRNYPRCMPGLIRCVAAVRSCHCRDPTAILACLERHSLFPKAQICIAKNLPDLESRKEKAAYVRAVMAALVLFAGGVGDIRELVGCLQRPPSPMSLMDINEMLYCTATLLYAMRGNGIEISNRFYYNVYYYLHTLENSPRRDINPELQDCRTDLQPTREQQQILNHAFKTPGERVKIVAFAGTGKTYTLIQYTKKCYGRELELFPLTSYVASFLQTNRQEKSPFIAKMIVQTLAAFYASADDSITADHTPKWFKNNPGKYKKYGCDAQVLCQIVVEEAKEIWSEMQTSFRFGFEIAYVGATILDVSQGVRKKTLVGNKQESDVSGVGVEGKVAHLSRTNKTVFEDAVKLTRGDAPAKIHLLGGLEAFGLDQIRDIWALLHERKLEIQDPFIQSWEGFALFKSYAKEAEDEELKSKIAIVEKTPGSIPDLLDKISQHHVSAPEEAGHHSVLKSSDVGLEQICSKK
ncbi:F-box DNA helicase 1 [Protobothrops mucrosquamatus]|uniref:F-box DNA helicase 1 n=1 Tax=Protobothrops mucrosquamatus TaxID=103944 RepID=UPI0010FB4A4F|nr:F-box DNA helicase 1 [Protobothrops mucrosquamatus]